MIFDGVPLSDHTGNIKANVQAGFVETLHEYNRQNVGSYGKVYKFIIFSSVYRF
jgi:hypothetical protein